MKQDNKKNGSKMNRKTVGTFTNFILLEEAKWDKGEFLSYIAMYVIFDDVVLKDGETIEFIEDYNYKKVKGLQ